MAQRSTILVTRYINTYKSAASKQILRCPPKCSFSLIWIIFVSESLTCLSPPTTTADSASVDDIVILAIPLYTSIASDRGRYCHFRTVYKCSYHEFVLRSPSLKCWNIQLQYLVALIFETYWSNFNIFFISWTLIYER